MVNMDDKLGKSMEIMAVYIFIALTYLLIVKKYNLLWEDGVGWRGRVRMESRAAGVDQIISGLKGWHFLKAYKLGIILPHSHLGCACFSAAIYSNLLT